MASFGDILSSLGTALQTGADYGMQQMGAGGGMAQPAQFPQAQPPQAPAPIQYQDDTKQPVQGAPGMSRLNILQYLLGMAPLTPQTNLLNPYDNYLGRMSRP